MKVIIFSRSNCSACDQLKRYLKERGVEYTDIDGMSPAGRAKMLVNQVFVSYFPALCVDGKLYEYPHLFDEHGSLLQESINGILGLIA